MASTDNDFGPLPWASTHNQVYDPVAGWIPMRMPGLVTLPYDYIGLGYTGSDLTTVTYRMGGPSGPVVATLTLAYAGGVLQSVTKS